MTLFIYGNQDIPNYISIDRYPVVDICNWFSILHPNLTTIATIYKINCSKKKEISCLSYNCSNPVVDIWNWFSILHPKLTTIATIFKINCSKRKEISCLSYSCSKRKFRKKLTMVFWPVERSHLTEAMTIGNGKKQPRNSVSCEKGLVQRK